ncbi:Conserved_hypothetical protein [Hexamita inflata]|uniref:Ankyrin repeat protein n=1 Tax=Hexamita inflata TaxID=28002 RepID=A0AA86Q1F4_9EUKA|nr:Conserved hypothetical protein [Hexamita inflata]
MSCLHFKAGSSLWFAAAIKGDLDTIKKLHADNVNSYDRDEHRTPGVCAIHYAMLNLHYNLVDYLITYEFQCLTRSPLIYNERQLQPRSTIAHLACLISDSYLLDSILSYMHKHQHHLLVQQNEGEELALEVFIRSSSVINFGFFYDDFLSIEFEWSVNKSNKNVFKTALRSGRVDFLNFIIEGFQFLQNDIKFRIAHQVLSLENTQFSEGVEESIGKLRFECCKCLNEIIRTKMIMKNIYKMKFFKKKLVRNDKYLNYLQTVERAFDE